MKSEQFCVAFYHNTSYKNNCRLEIQDVNVQKPNVPKSYDQNSLKMCDKNNDDDDDGHVYDGLIIPKRRT